VQASLLDDVFRNVSNGGDFRRGGFMFTPVVNSVMKSVAAEAKQKGVRIIGGTVTAPRQPSVPEGDINLKIKALRRKKHEVNNFDKKHGRTHAKVFKKGTIEIRRTALGLSKDTAGDDDVTTESSVPFAPSVPNRPQSAAPSASSYSSNRSNFRSIRDVSDCDNSQKSLGGHEAIRPSSAIVSLTASPPTGLIGSRRRPNIKNQKSVYAQQRKKESNRINKTLFTGKDDEGSDDDECEFNTFKTGFNRRKRAVSPHKSKNMT
jgi:hypothetical protein